MTAELTYKETDGIIEGQACDVERHGHVAIVSLNHHLKQAATLRFGLWYDQSENKAKATLLLDGFRQNPI